MELKSFGKLGIKRNSTEAYISPLRGGGKA
jgi:hypothetical protein